MNIIPGEPIPPGFEDEVNRQPQIQASVDQYKGNALIGVEYTIELHEDDRHEPGYLCTLCDKRGDPRTIINHWCSFNHRMKYLEKHYPSAVRECQPVKYKPNSHNIMILIVQSLAEAIEDHFGRLKVCVMNADDFRKRKSVITEQIMKKNHFDEKSGPNFLNAIDRTLWEQKVPLKKKDAIIKAPKRLNTNTGNGKNSLGAKDGLDEISSDSDNQDSAKKPKSQTRVQEPAFTQKQRISPLSVEDTGKKLPTPKELSLQASHIAQERYKWEKYRCMLEIQLKQMEKIQADYEKTPEKHPHYPEEWKKFWNRRYKELQAEKKIDPNTYDYKPEWIIFWTKRIKELFNAEVEKKKKEIKVKLGLPENAEEKVNQLKEKYKLPVNRLTPLAKSNSRSGQNLDVIDISDDDSPRTGRYTKQRRSRTRSHSRSRSPRGMRQRNYRRSHSRSRSRSRTLSPFSDEYEHPTSSKHHLHKKSHNPIRPYGVEHPPSDYYPYSRVLRYPPSNALPSHYPSASHHYRVLDASQIPKYQESDSRLSKDIKEEVKEEEPEGPLTVVAVLRLLTALEEHLGSLGPKVVDMLGKALALEKVKGNSSDDLLMNEDHCVFFETIKEKLKGLLIADVLDDQQKVKAVKRAIKNIAAIIHLVTTKGSSTETTKDNNEGSNTDGTAKGKKTQNKKSSAGPNIKDLPFDRQTVATKLAAALVMEGREDVSTADMDKLIYMFILMVKLSKPNREDDGKPLYCNDILPQLGIARKLPTSTLSLANLPAIVDDLLENEVSALVQEVEEEMENEVAVNKEAKNDNNSSMLESLTDSDLQTLLQNFKHLSSEEQHHLIAHLKKLESADPSRVEKLRKFVNISDITGTKEATNKSAKTSDSTPTKSSSSSRSKPRLDDTPPSGSRKAHNALPPGTEDDDDDDNRRRVNPNKFSLDDDEDDDYNFDDVFKAASSNVNRLSEEHSRQSDKNTKSPIVPVSSSPSALTFNPAGLKTSSLNDTQNLIANLMGSLQQSNSANKPSTSSSLSSSSAAKPAKSQPKAPQPVPPVSAATHHQQMPPQANQMAHYQQQQQQQQQAYPGPYNQMNQAQANYYNSMGGYNQNPYDGYQQWGQGPPQQMAPQNMQQFGMQGFSMPPQQMGYNMYGPGHN